MVVIAVGAMGCTASKPRLRSKKQADYGFRVVPFAAIVAYPMSRGFVIGSLLLIIGVIITLILIAKKNTLPRIHIHNLLCTKNQV
jgi:hypothetical protein